MQQFELWIFGSNSNIDFLEPLISIGNIVALLVWVITPNTLGYVGLHHHGQKQVT
jgi:hypothetical protein